MVAKCGDMGRYGASARYLEGLTAAELVELVEERRPFSFVSGVDHGGSRRLVVCSLVDDGRGGVSTAVGLITRLVVGRRRREERARVPAVLVSKSWELGGS